MPDVADRPDPTDDDELPAPPFDPWVCPRCLGDNPPTANLCRHCGAPVYGIATTGFLEAGVAQGWALAETIGTPSPNRLLLIGGLLLVVAFMIGPGLFFLAIATQPLWWSPPESQPSSPPPVTPDSTTPPIAPPVPPPLSSLFEIGFIAPGIGGGLLVVAGVYLILRIVRTYRDGPDPDDEGDPP